MINKWGKMKKFFLLIGSLILYAPLLFGFAASAHNTDIGYILYGYSTWEEMQKAPNNVQLSYFIVSDAAVFAIDYQAIGDNGSDKYNELQQNINKTSKSFKLPDISSFITNMTNYEFTIRSCIIICVTHIYIIFIRHITYYNINCFCIVKRLCEQF